MSLGAGAVSIKRLKILENPSNISIPWIIDKIQGHEIAPLVIGDTSEESMGWCHPFSGEPDFSNPYDLVFEDHFVFGMRKDSKKIPGTLFRIQMKSALEALMNKIDAENKQKKAKRIPKHMRDAARDRIKMELLRHTLPTIRLVEIVWQIQTNELWLTSSSPKVLESFDKLFQETFALPFIQLNPGTMAVEFSRLDNDKDYHLDSLFDLIPSDLLHHRSAELQKNNASLETSPF